MLNVLPLEHCSLNTSHQSKLCIGNHFQNLKFLRVTILPRARAFYSAGLRLRADGKRPDGMIITPWSTGQPLVWDATGPDTFAVSYRIQATSGAGKVAELTEERKDSKYKHHGLAYIYTPIAIKTSGTIRSRAFLKELGRQLRYDTGEANSCNEDDEHLIETVYYIHLKLVLSDVCILI